MHSVCSSADEQVRGVLGRSNPDIIAARKAQVLELEPRVYRETYNVYATADVGPLLYKIQAPTLEGLHELTIPEGTQNGAQLRIKGKGIAEVQGRGRGDLIVHIEVRTPTKLSRDQRRLLEELQQTLPLDNDPHEKGLLDKVKDYFM